MLRNACWPCRRSDVGAARATARDGRVVALAPGSTLLAAESENGREHPNWYRGKVIRIYVEETDGDGTYETYERHRETRDNRSGGTRQPNDCRCRGNRERRPAERDATVVRRHTAHRGDRKPCAGNTDNACKQRGRGGYDVPPLANNAPAPPE